MTRIHDITVTGTNLTTVTASRAVHDFMAQINTQPWMARAICRTMDPETMFPSPGRDVSKRARQICKRCPVKRKCLNYALSLSEAPYGVWGGTTKLQREQMRKQRRAAA